MKNTLQRYGHLINLQIIQEKSMFYNIYYKIELLFGLV